MTTKTIIPADRIDQLTKEKHSMEIAALKLADDYDALKSDLARVTAERDHWIALYKERNKTAAILEDTSIALRARVAESATPAKHGGSAH